MLVTGCNAARNRSARIRRAARRRPMDKEHDHRDRPRRRPKMLSVKMQSESTSKGSARHSSRSFARRRTEEVCDPFPANRILIPTDKYAPFCACLSLLKGALIVNISSGLAFIPFAAAPVHCARSESTPIVSFPLMFMKVFPWRSEGGRRARRQFDTNALLVRRIICIGRDLKRCRRPLAGEYKGERT